jgi:hypothetical protein
MLVQMLAVGAEQSMSNWISTSTTPGGQCCRMLHVASSIAAAVAAVSPRKTFTGEAWRSAIAPKISGETKAATAEAAKAKGLIAPSPCASKNRTQRHEPDAHRHPLDEETAPPTRSIPPCESF